MSTIGLCVTRIPLYGLLVGPDDKEVWKLRHILRDDLQDHRCDEELSHLVNEDITDP